MEPTRPDQELRERIVYPDTDGEPMSDSDANADRMIDTFTALARAHRSRGRKAYVSKNLFVYPVRGKPWLRNSPDILVAPGCEDRKRPSFKYWEEPGRVLFAGEFISFLRRETLESPEVEERIDFYRKELGTRELFIYQPLGKNQEDGYRFFFFRLRSEGPDEEIEPGEDGWYRSEILDLDLRPLDDRVEFRDPATGEIYLPDSIRAEREAQRAERETERAEREAAARKDLEAEVRRLRAELEGRRRDV
ncbi:MAG: hypothetical protein HY720_06265 [Planctomycetes bacterium]|nr:hypothetical protein [Planctomycetota bacterium]